MKKLVLATLALGFAASVGHANALGEAAKTFELQGKTFESDCKSPKMMHIFSAKGYKVQMRFRGDQINRETKYFANSDCTGPNIMTFVETGTFDRLDQAGPAGTDQIDIHYKKLQARVDSEEGKHFAEKELFGACGQKHWSIGQLVDVTSHAHHVNCFMRRVPYEVRDLYRLDGTTLRLGHGYEDMQTEQRPSGLSQGEELRSI